MPVVLDARAATDHFPGIGRYVVHLADALGRVAPELDLSLLYDPTAAASRLSLPALPRLTASASPFSLRQQWEVPARLRGAGATLYHSPYYLMPYRPGVPTVLTCYDVIPLIYPRYFRASQRLIYRWAHHLALRTAAAVLSISEATRADLAARFGLHMGRVAVTPLAAGAGFSPQPAGAIDAVRARLGLPEEYVLYLGSNKPHKNLPRLIEAWGLLRGALDPAMRLVVAGPWDGRYPEARAAVGAAGLSGSVLFVGAVDEADLPPLYSGARVFVFPSLYEGFGLPILEAMACGAPVACSGTSSMPEVAGDAALPFDPHEADSIAQVLCRILRDADLQRELRARSMRRASEFSWERTARMTSAVYREVLGKGTHELA